MVQQGVSLWTLVTVFVNIWCLAKCYECICNDDVLNRPEMLAKLPTSSKPDIIGSAFPGDCFFYNGTTSFRDKLYWKTDFKGKSGWFESDIPGLNIVNCSHPLMDMKEGADCVCLMKKTGFYRSPTDSEYWMIFDACRKSKDCPILKSNDVITANNRTWFYVGHPRFDDDGYVSTAHAFRWRCRKVVSLKGDNFATWKIVVLSTVSFLVVVTLPIALIFICRRRKNLFKLKVQDQEQYDGSDKHFQEEYDVFVSYSREDWDWVRQTLFEKLRHGGYSVCIDFKDFVPGMDVSDNIMSCIYKSRKTIIVMSKNFLKSMWGQFELNHAHYRGICQRKDTLILIKFGKCKVPNRLMGKTFLDWTCKTEKDTYFWKRLFGSIGKPIRDVAPKIRDIT